ncbi:hypothetical protein BC828DRAFT_438058 [Blastocladiella britannica]|nr:hypothetical protein BC828DRAFT_438058 [Blastocladiella britannica]
MKKDGKKKPSKAALEAAKQAALQEARLAELKALRTSYIETAALVLRSPLHPILSHLDKCLSEKEDCTALTLPPNVLANDVLSLLNTFQSYAPLKSIFLVRCAVDERMAVALAKFLSSGVSSELHLEIRDCKLVEKTATPILEAIPHSRVRTLVLDYNATLGASPNVLSCLRKPIGSCAVKCNGKTGLHCGLERLSLKFSDIGPDVATDISIVMKEAPSLREVDLSGNRILSAGFIAVMSTLKHGAAIERLMLAGNGIKEVPVSSVVRNRGQDDAAAIKTAIKELVTAIESHEKITEIDLRHNCFSDQSILDVTAALKSRKAAIAAPGGNYVPPVSVYITERTSNQLYKGVHDINKTMEAVRKKRAAASKKKKKKA